MYTTLEKTDKLIGLMKKSSTVDATTYKYLYAISMLEIKDTLETDNPKDYSNIMKELQDKYGEHYAKALEAGSALSPTELTTDHLSTLAKEGISALNL